MADFDAKRLQDEGGNNLNFVPTNFMDAQGNSKPIEVEFGKKQNTLSLEADSADISDNTTIVKTLDGVKLKTALAIKFWNYIKGKANSVYAALSHSHSISDISNLSSTINGKQDQQTRVTLTQSSSDVDTDPVVVGLATLNILRRSVNNGNNIFVTYKVGELSDGYNDITAAYINVPYAISDPKASGIHVLLDLTDATRTNPLFSSTENILYLIVRDSGGTSLFREDGKSQTIACRFGLKYIVHITGSTFTAKPIERDDNAYIMPSGNVNTNAWSTIGSGTVDFELCDWGDYIANYIPGTSNAYIKRLGTIFNIVYTLSIIVENNSSSDINVAFNLGRRNRDSSQTRPVLLGCGQYAIVPANSRKYIDLSATDILIYTDFENNTGNLKLYMTKAGGSWTATDRVYIGKGHAVMLIKGLDPIQH